MRAIALLLVLAAAAQAGGSPAGTATDPWRVLYRPLHVPRLPLRAECPVSRADGSVPFSRFGVARGLGAGPAYPIGFDSASSLHLAPARNFESRHWAGQKVLWFVHPRYRGPVLIRGRQLDGPNLVRFERGDIPPPELRIEPGESRTQWNGKPTGARGQPSYTRLRAPGCYGYQVNGTTFSRIIVFRGVRAV